MTPSLCARLQQAQRNGFTGPDAAEQCTRLLGEAEDYIAAQKRTIQMQGNEITSLEALVAQYREAAELYQFANKLRREAGPFMGER